MTTTLGFALLYVGGWPLVNWAIFLRVVVGLHATWLINSATHIFGGRRFETDDDSRNVWWVALLTFGEGRSWKLIEKLAADIAALVLSDFGAEAVSVEVKKFIIPETRHVSVRMTRRKG